MRRRQPPMPPRAIPREPTEQDALLLSLICEGSSDQVAQALASGASPNAMAPEGSPLVQLLSSQLGPRVVNRPALLAALEMGQDPDTARVLLAAGADPNAQAFGATALDIALERRPDMCLELIDAGANIHDRSLWSAPAISAVRHGRLDAYKALVAKGASPKDRDWKGRTAPMCAALWGQLPMLAHLLCENLWEDGERKPSWAQESPLGAPKEPRACALDPAAAWGSRPGLGEIAAALIDAARAIRSERAEAKRSARELGERVSSRARPIEPSELYAKVEANGVDLVARGSALLAGGELGRDETARQEGQAKAREWMAHLLSTHPAWRLQGEALARELSARESQVENDPATSLKRALIARRGEGAAMGLSAAKPGSRPSLGA